MTDQHRCVVCTKPVNVAVSGERLACAVCERRMHDQLTDVLEFYAIAEGELVPGSSSGARGNERSIGVRITALDFLAGHDVVAILASWESDWRETYELSIDPMLSRPAPALSRSVGFLTQWLPRACTDHPAIDEFARELRECWALAQSAARVSPARSLSITCVADDERRHDGICGKRIPVGIDEIRGRVTCRRCRTEWDVPHLMHVAISTPGAELWADPEAAAGYFRITSKTLRQWARADRIRREHGRYELHSIHQVIHGAVNTG
ncbi:MAG: hypothetical protein RL134_649 [Actinomycetota bacterium]|jgi:hypothetical protein